MNSKLTQQLLRDPSLIRTDFREPQDYDSKVLALFNKTTDISVVARDSRVSFKNIIRLVISENKAIPWQPIKPVNKEGKFRGVIGEILFNGFFDALDTNDIEPNHRGWDFEYNNCLIEIKSTAPKGGKKGSAKLTQGELPDVYVIFKFDNAGALKNVYALPVRLLKQRPKGIPKNVKIDKSQWISKFEVKVEDLGAFFHTFYYYRKFLKVPISYTKYDVERCKPISIDINFHITFAGYLAVNSIYRYKHQWWLTYFRLECLYKCEFNSEPNWDWDSDITRM